MVTSDFPESTLGFISAFRKPCIVQGVLNQGAFGEEAEICCLVDDPRQ